jgi:hypothetical protein
MRRNKSFWMWTQPIYRCTASRKGAFSTAIKTATAIYGCISSAASMFCARGCDNPTAMLRPGAWRRLNGLSAGFERRAGNKDHFACGFRVPPQRADELV